MEVELAKLERNPVVGGALDLYKCFDRIVGQLLYVILALAGCPHRVLVAYIAYQEHCVVLNSFGGALGKPHQRQCGIPQGCPLSMCFIALLLRPWSLQMASLAAMARTLADDILLLTKGGRALHLFHEAFNLIILHLHDLGGKVAPAKSLGFRNCCST